MGRTTSVPKAHTNQASQPTAGNLAITYGANDMVASLQQTAVDPDSGAAQVRKQTFTLDGSDRISITKGYTDNVQLTETLDHYDSDEDSPAWTQTANSLRGRSCRANSFDDDTPVLMADGITKAHRWGRTWRPGLGLRPPNWRSRSSHRHRSHSTFWATCDDSDHPH